MHSTYFWLLNHSSCQPRNSQNFWSIRSTTILWEYILGSSVSFSKTLILTFKWVSSPSKPLRGSSPRGSFLGVFLFIVKFNGASLRPAIPRVLQFCRLQRSKCPLSECLTHNREFHAIYIDHLSESEAINVKKQLISDPVTRPVPLTYHERTNQILPANGLLENNLKRKTFTDKKWISLWIDIKL